MVVVVVVAVVVVVVVSVGGTGTTGDAAARRGVRVFALRRDSVARVSA